MRRAPISIVHSRFSRPPLCKTLEERYHFPMNARSGVSHGVRVAGEMRPGFDGILTPDALRFVAGLHRKFEVSRAAALQRRLGRQAELDSGRMPDFLEETRDLRRSPWAVT